MAMPYSGDVEFDSAASYSPEEGVEPVKRVQGADLLNFDNSAPETSAEQGRSQSHYNTNSLWNRFLDRVDVFKQFLADSCCAFLSSVPTVGLVIIGALFILLLILGLIPLIVFMSLRSQQGMLHSDEPRSVVSLQRTHNVWPSFEKEDPSSIPPLSASVLLPLNISRCDGYGFACTSLPSLVIGTRQRCDGVADCPDGSDEIGCKTCQTAFSCELQTSGGDSPHLMCVRGSSLCDGISDCPDGSDEKRFCQRECESDELRCNGTEMCVSESLRCDGDVHCREGDDEINCEGKCRSGAIWCESSQRCIPGWQVCDAIPNCSDGSDELGCDCTGCCGKGKALCKNGGKCIDRSRLCDGTADCPLGDDEHGCPGSCPEPSSEVEDEEMILCSDGKRYNKKHACSGLLEQCQGKCEKCDAEIAFTCTNNKCVPRAMMCDGVNDCGDRSDEQGCGCDKLKMAGKVMQCAATADRPNRKCIPEWRRCDGYEDCPDGDDERNCDDCRSNPAAIYCNATRTCFPSTKRCDGFDDCPNGIDESECTCAECSKQPFSMYMCSGSARCFPRSRVCSPYSRCPHASPLDKLFCANKARIARYGD